MSDLTPPVIGQEPWGEDLNAYLASLASAVASNTSQITDTSALEAQVAELSAQVATNTDVISDLRTRVEMQEARPEYIYVNTAYMYSPGKPPATGNQIRIDNDDVKLGTIMDVRRMDADGADRSFVLGMLSVGSHIRINDYDDAAIWHRYSIVGPTTKAGPDNWYIPILWHSGQGVLASTKINVGLFIVVPPL